VQLPREAAEVLPWPRQRMGACVCVPGMSRREEGARAGARRVTWAVRRPERVKGGADPQRSLGMLCSVSGDKEVVTKVTIAQLMGMGDMPGPNTGISPYSWDSLAPSGDSVPCLGRVRFGHIPAQPACCRPGLLGTHLGLCISGLESFGDGLCTASGGVGFQTPAARPSPARMET